MKLKQLQLYYFIQKYYVHNCYSRVILIQKSVLSKVIVQWLQLMVYELNNKIYLMHKQHINIVMKNQYSNWRV